MIVVILFVFLTLQAVAFIHLGWAFGMSWPAASRDALGAMVVGVPEGTPMPSRGLTILVAMGISAAGWLALWGAGWFSLGGLDGLRPWALAAAGVIFTLRGVMTYLPFGPLQASVEPFRSLDRLYFAPLIWLLAAGFWLLLVKR